MVLAPTIFITNNRLGIGKQVQTIWKAKQDMPIKMKPFFQNHPSKFIYQRTTFRKLQLLKQL